ncbi:porin [uncultured Draconibacterium sp.]|uniref:porin n=1 Tax=uncultured Draconibacterium sp. TaxID=1573823 RepID=UPI003260F8F4
MKFKGILILLLFTGLVTTAGKTVQEKPFRPSIMPYLKLQFWNVASQGLTSADEKAASRFTSYFRRGRLGLKGKVLPELSYNAMVSFDNLAKDGFSSTKGLMNAGAVALWSAYFTYDLSPKNDWLNLTGGYFLPHLSRESTTAPWTTSSLDKTENSCYLRQFVTGKANGICPGINLGGLGDLGKQTLIYNIAIINRQDAVSIMERNWSPVLLGHLMLNFGHKEFSKYNYCFSNNLLKKQTSAILGLAFSAQGKTDAFKSNQTISADASIYLGHFKIDGEYSFLIRKHNLEYNANCFMLRTGYNIFLKRNLVFEPTAMFEKFSGDKNFNDVSFFDGSDKKLDVGVNLISMAKKIKVNLHYVHHDGEGKKNRYIKNETFPGDYVALGL